MPIKQPLESCPLLISNWVGQKAPDFDERSLAVLGVDEYINRMYTDASQKPLSLYVGYYASQRQGDTMHSPLNCLPGAGWSPVSFSRIGIPMRATEQARDENVTVNRYVIEKGLDRQMVLYWYQSQGRVIASEYWGKFYLVLDAIRTNRTDGALVRIESRHGRMLARLSHDDKQRRDVALVPKGGHLRDGRCANALIGAATTDLGEGGALYDERVRVVAVSSEGAHDAA